MTRAIDARRRVILRAVAGVATLASATLFAPIARVRAELVRLSEDEPRARRLEYVHDAARADPVYRTVKLGVPGAEQFCAKCRWLREGQGEWRPCLQFPDRLVNVNGWCVYWEPKG